MDKCMSEDLVPLQDDAEDARIMQLIESLRHDEDRADALAALVDTYAAKVAEIGKAGENGKRPAPKTVAHQRHIRTLLRLSVQCPHKSIRAALSELMVALKACPGLSVPAAPRLYPSVYLSKTAVPTMVECDDAAAAEFVEAFRADGRVSHMTQVMACHPEYLTRFRELHNCLLWDEGPLPLPERHLIAVVASGRHNCQYLAEIHAKHFLDLGGDPLWLKGESHLPHKLRSLLEINAILAHQPWRLNVAHISRLVKSGVDSWSLNELVHALSIMIHFHALQSFVLGCGMTVELDLLDGDDAAVMPPPPLDARDEPAAADAGAAAGAAAAAAGAAPMGARGGPGGAGGGTDACSAFAEVRAKLRAAGAGVDPDDTEEANLEAFALAETEEAKSPQQQQAVRGGSQWFPLYECSLLSSSGDRLIPGHEDFDIRSKEYSIFRTQDFSWADHCYSTLSRYCPDIAELMDSEFSSITSLTYETMGDEGEIDTFNFRWAIWNYTLRTQGVVNDEYMYRNVNKWLPRSVKSFVKTTVCYPQLSSKGQWLNMDDIKDSERVHINLLATCARKQAELLYALHAVSQFVTERE